MRSLASTAAPPFSACLIPNMTYTHMTYTHTHTHMTYTHIHTHMRRTGLLAQVVNARGALIKGPEKRAFRPHVPAPPPHPPAAHSRFPFLSCKRQE